MVGNVMVNIIFNYGKVTTAFVTPSKHCWDRGDKGCSCPLYTFHPKEVSSYFISQNPTIPPRILLLLVSCCMKDIACVKFVLQTGVLLLL